MNNLFKKTSFIMVLSMAFSSCVNDKFDDPQFDDCVNSGLAKTKEVSELYTLATTTTVVYPKEFNTQNEEINKQYIEGYVISSDEGGNFFKSMYIQPTDGTKGFNLSIDEYNLYTKGFAPGRKVYLKLGGLAYAEPTSYGIGLIFGAPPTEQYAVDRLPVYEYKKHLFSACPNQSVKEDDIVKQLTIAQAKSDTYLNTLVELNNVQFESECGTYDSNINDTFDSSVKITDGSSTIDIRTSRFAAFAGKDIQPGKGKIRGVLTKYGSTYQIILRTERDVKLTDPRVDMATAKIGNSIAYTTTFNENFESYATSTNGLLFPKYVNDALQGNRYWDVKSFSSNKYIQMTSYNGGCAKTYLAMPATFTPGYKFSFKTKDGYYVGDVLRVYYTKAYTPGADFSTVQMTDITSKFAIAKGTTGGYASNFTNSGDFVIPTDLTGDGFFIFEYSGDGVNSTTIQIDDVKLVQ